MSLKVWKKTNWSIGQMWLPLRLSRTRVIVYGVHKQNLKLKSWRVSSGSHLRFFVDNVVLSSFSSHDVQHSLEMSVTECKAGGMIVSGGGCVSETSLKVFKSDPKWKISKSLLAWKYFGILQKEQQGDTKERGVWDFLLYPLCLQLYLRKHPSML